MDREARIKLIAEGASRAASDVRQVSGEVGNLGKVAGGVSKALKDIGASAYRAASDAARAMNDVKPISFASAADSAKRFDDSVTRLAVRANRDVGMLKQQFRDTGKEIGVMPDKVAAAARALTKMTGSSDASDAIRDLGAEELPDEMLLASVAGRQNDQIGGQRRAGAEAREAHFVHLGADLVLAEARAEASPPSLDDGTLHRVLRRLLSQRYGGAETTDVSTEAGTTTAAICTTTASMWAAGSAGSGCGAAGWNGASSSDSGSRRITVPIRRKRS